MFIVALFTIAKTWRQPKCPSTDKRIKKMSYILCNGILLSHKNEILPFSASCMDLEGIMFSEISQTEKDKYRMISLMWNLKNTTN